MHSLYSVLSHPQYHNPDSSLYTPILSMVMTKEHYHESITVFPNAKAYCKDLVQWIQTLVSQRDMRPVSILHISEYPSHVDPTSFVVLISGEPDAIPHQVGVTICPFLHQPQPSLYYPFLYMSLSERTLYDLARQPKTKTCAFMYNQNYAHRNDWFHRIHAHLPVDAMGKACNNTGAESTRHVHNEHETYNDIAVRTYASYQFVLAIENTWKDGYFTEKILNPILAHSIPLYWGHPHVFEYINKNRVLYLPDFESDDAIVARLHHLQTHPVEYESILNEPCYTPRGDPERVAREFKLALAQVLDKSTNTDKS